MRHVLALVVLACSIAAADDTAPLHPVEGRVRDPSGAIKDGEVAAALEAGPVANMLARCPHPTNADLLVWIVFDHGKVVAADAGGSSDRKLEACVLTAVKRATLTSSKARVVATVELVTPLVAMLTTVQKRAASTSEAGSGAGSAASPSSSSSGPPAVGAGSATAPPVGVGSGSAVTPPVGSAPAGSAVVPSETKVTAATPDCGALTPEQIDRVVRAKASTFRGCYDIARRDQPDLSGKFVYHFEIDATGHVTTAKAKSVMPPARLDDCLVRVLKSLTFPASTGPSIVDYPLAFTTN